MKNRTKFTIVLISFLFILSSCAAQINGNLDFSKVFPESFQKNKVQEVKVESAKAEPITNNDEQKPNETENKKNEPEVQEELILEQEAKEENNSTVEEKNYTKILILPNTIKAKLPNTLTSRIRENEFKCLIIPENLKIDETDMGNYEIINQSDYLIYYDKNSLKTKNILDNLKIDFINNPDNLFNSSGDLTNIKPFRKKMLQKGLNDNYAKVAESLNQIIQPQGKPNAIIIGKTGEVKGISETYKNDFELPINNELKKNSFTEIAELCGKTDVDYLTTFAYINGLNFDIKLCEAIKIDSLDNLDQNAIVLYINE